MSVNSAIRGSAKIPTLRVAKNESQGTRPVEKENNSSSIHTSQSEQDITVVVSGAMALPDSVILKAVQQNSQVKSPPVATMNNEAAHYEVDDGNQELQQNDARLVKANHGRNFSVNLPYASKAGLHTNMSTLQVSKKSSHPTTNNGANANAANS